MADKNQKKFQVNTPEGREKIHKYKVYILWTCIFATVILLAWAFGEEPTDFKKAAKYKGIGPVDTEETRNEAFTSRLNQQQKQLEDLEALIKLANEQAILREENLIKRLNGQVQNSLNSNAEAFDAKIKDLKSSYVSPPIKGGSQKNENKLENVPFGNDTSIPPPPSITREIIETDRNEFQPSPFSSDAPKVNSQSAILSASDNDVTSSTKLVNDKVPVEERWVKNELAGTIPATSTIPITIYTGVDAIASAEAQATPVPVHFLMTDNAWLPANARYRVGNCHGVATTRADLSTTRVGMRSTRIVCLDVINNKMIESELSGFITDSDSIFGMRGTVNNREGQIAGKAFAAAFIEGAAKLVAASSTTTTTVGGAALQSINANEALRGGVGAGTGRAAEILAERYIKQMEQIAPTIMVDAGRKGNLHISVGKQLVWKDYTGAYKTEFTPISSDEDS